MRDEHRLHQIQLARQAVLEDGVPPGGGPVAGGPDRAWLERSWRRCLNQGQRPNHAVSFDLVPANARRQAEESQCSLLAAARPELQRLARAVAPIRYFAILTDASGMVVDVAGAIDRHDRRADAIARVGIDLSERSIGTSAIGAALGEQQPVWLHRGEHFFCDTSVYSCAGAPLLGPTGQCVGMLDLTGIDAPERPELKHLVARSAVSIETSLALGVPHALRLDIHWADSAPGDIGGALLCLDADGAVVSANSAARQMLPRVGDLAQTTVHADDLFAGPWQSLFDHAQRGEPVQLPLWSGLRVTVQARRPTHPAPARSALAAPSSLKIMEAELIRQAVRQAGGNVSQAAAALGLSRATMYRRLAAARRPATPQSS